MENMGEIHSLKMEKTRVEIWRLMTPHLMNQAVGVIHMNEWMPLDLPRSVQTLLWVGSYMKSVSPNNLSTDV